MTAAIWWRTLKLVYRISPKLVGCQAGLTILSGLLTGVNVAIVAWMVTQVSSIIDSGSPENLMYPLAVSAGVFLLNKLVLSASEYCDALLIDLVTNFFTLQIADKTSNFELEDFEDSKTYDQIQVVIREASQRPYQILTGTFGVIQSLASLLAVVSAVAQWNILVAVLMVLSPIAGMLVSNILGVKLWKVEVERTNQRRLGQYLVSIITNDRTFKEVKTLGTAPDLLSRYSALLGSFFSTDKKLQGKLLTYGSLAAIVESLFYLTALYLALKSSVSSHDIGRLAGYLAGITSSAAAAGSLLSAASLLYQNSLFLTSVFSFLDRPIKKIDSGDLTPPESLTHGVIFENVSYTYPNTEKPALDGVNVFIPAGSKIGIVGENGAGKTTFVKLLARLYQPTSGSITWDQQPIQDYDIDSVRQSVSVLYQDFCRYELTVRDVVGFGNIKYRNSDEKLWSAIQRTGIDSLVQSYPKKLDQQLGSFFDEGIQPSGGQWQRFALARTLFSDAPVLVFDEPSAALDPHAENDIQRLIYEDSTKTRIIVTHNFSLVKKADLILVFSDGKIVESGTHDELMRFDGEYKSMYLVQSQGYK